jgi:hypothetical protein
LSEQGGRRQRDDDSVPEAKCSKNVCGYSAQQSGPDLNRKNVAQRHIFDGDMKAEEEKPVLARHILVLNCL